MKFDSTHIDIHIFRFLESAATEEEQVSLLHWVKASAANKQYYVEQVNLYKSINAESIKVDTSTALNKVKHSMHAASVSGSTSLFHFSKWMYTLLAGAILMGGILYFFASDPTVVPKNQKISEKYMYSATDTILDVVLKDSTLLSLNKASTATYFETDTSRELVLSGNAYIDVYLDSMRPFNIRSGTWRMQTYGKRFDIKRDTLKGTVSVTAIDGSIIISDSLQEGFSKINEQQVFEQKIGETSRTTGVNNLNCIAWKTGLLHFDNTPLYEALPQIEDFFEEKIIVKDSDILNCEINAKLNRYGFEDVLTMLEIAFGIKVEKQDSVVFLSGKGCK